MQVYMYSNRTSDTYSAKGVYLDKKLKVLAGSKIALNLKENFRPYAIVVKLRNDNSVVNSEGILLKDIEFSSASGAAQFVSGRSTDGLLAWKVSRGVPLKKMIE